MQYRVLGSTGLSVSVIGLGCNQQRRIGVIANQLLMKGTLLHGGAASGLAQVQGPHARSLAQGAVRYVTDLPGVSTVLTGTTSIAHLDENVAALAAPPLSDEELTWLRRDRAAAIVESVGPPR